MGQRTDHGRRWYHVVCGIAIESAYALGLMLVAYFIGAVVLKAR